MPIPNCPAQKFLEAGHFGIDICFLLIGRMFVCVCLRGDDEQSFLRRFSAASRRLHQELRDVSHSSTRSSQWYEKAREIRSLVSQIELANLALHNGATSRAKLPATEFLTRWESFRKETASTPCAFFRVGQLSKESEDTSGLSSWLRSCPRRSWLPNRLSICCSTCRFSELRWQQFTFERPRRPNARVPKRNGAVSLVEPSHCERC
jgi:hypothetical protein